MHLHVIFLSIFWIIFFVLVVICAFYYLNLIYQIDDSKPPPFKFSTDVKFTHVNEDIIIENKKSCNIRNLVTCEIDNPVALFGCKELAVQCHHFEKDTIYNENEEEVLVPKNNNSNEGYALSIPIYNKACNIYHGKPTLISLDTDNNDYMMICDCTYPGYINNSHLLGDCTNIHICNGKVKDLHVPFEKVECVCESTKIPAKMNDGAVDVPVCKNLTIDEANKNYTDWTELLDFGNLQTLPKEYFSTTLKINTKVKKLRNPCFYTIDNKLNPNAMFNYGLRTCVTKDRGIPVRTGILDTKPGVIAEDPDLYMSVDGYIDTEPYEYIRYTDNVSKKRFIANGRTTLTTRLQNIPINKYINFNFPQPFSISTQLITDWSDTLFMLYPLPLINNMQAKSPNLYLTMGEAFYNLYYKFMFRNVYDHKDYGIPRSYYSSPIKNGILWSDDVWKSTANAECIGFKVDAYGVHIDHNIFNKNENYVMYGMMYVNKTSKLKGGGSLYFRNDQDKNIHYFAINLKSSKKKE